jgi:hypothetical protein
MAAPFALAAAAVAPAIIVAAAAAAKAAVAEQQAQRAYRADVAQAVVAAAAAIVTAVAATAAAIVEPAHEQQQKDHHPAVVTAITTAIPHKIASLFDSRFCAFITIYYAYSANCVRRGKKNLCFARNRAREYKARPFFVVQRRRLWYHIEVIAKLKSIDKRYAGGYKNGRLQHG